MAAEALGLFTTLRVRHGRVRFWADHQARLRDGARQLGLPTPSGDELRAEIAQAVGELPDARVRVTLQGDGRPPRVDARAYARPREPWRLRPVAASPREDIVRIKTTARAVYDEARRTAAGCDDALLTTRAGLFLECTIANLFLEAGDGRLLTPPPDAPILPGIARFRVLRAARALGIAVVEAPIGPAEADSARGCFVTNALFVAHPVAEIVGIRDGLATTLARCLRDEVIRSDREIRIIR